MKNITYEDKAFQYYLLPEYGKNKLISYAESMKELSLSYSFNSEEFNVLDKRECIMSQKLLENRMILSNQLNDISNILIDLAKESYYISGKMEKYKKQIIETLKENGLDIKNIYVVENQNNHLEIGITMKAIYDDVYDVYDIGKFITKLCKRKMTPCDDMPHYISEECVTIIYREQVRFNMLYGVSKATKAGETYCGDNYTYKEYSFGSVLGAIADGMGSGYMANKDSTMVVEILEQFLDTGFSIHLVASMINDMLLSQMSEPRSVTLDSFLFNQYTGDGQFYKVGASPSFIKRKDRVEVIKSCNLPLGIINKEKEDGQVVTASFEDSDFIVLVSDGILDSMDCPNPEDLLCRKLKYSDFTNCKELCNYILGMAIRNGEGFIKDDMTVLAMQVVKK